MKSQSKMYANLMVFHQPHFSFSKTESEHIISPGLGLYELCNKQY